MSRMNRVPNSVWRNPIHFIACGFGAGAMPWMPGTFGTLVGVIFYLALSHLTLPIYILVTVIVFVVGVFITGRVNHDFGTHDHPAAVWDEIAGFLFVMIAIPNRWYFILLGFIFFRVLISGNHGRLKL
jgi:phosphatidylglycerophosphatase A